MAAHGSVAIIFWSSAQRVNAFKAKKRVRFALGVEDRSSHLLIQPSSIWASGKWPTSSDTLSSFGRRNACVVSASVLNVVELRNSVIAVATMPILPLTGIAATASLGLWPRSAAK